jgi:uncharacterized membrane protein
MRGPAFLKTHRWDGRNEYFRFHPMQSLYSLIAALVLLGLLAWVVTWYR